MVSYSFMESSKCAVPVSKEAAGVSHRINREDTTLLVSWPIVRLAKTQLVARSSPANASRWKWSPLTATTLPPPPAPVFGNIAYALGGATYLNCTLFRVKSRRFMEISTSRHPALCEGAAHTIVVAVRRSAFTGVAPNLHVARPVVGKSLPVTVTCVPPETDPATGNTAVMFGTGAYVKSTSISVSVRSPKCDARPTGAAPAACAGTRHALADCEIHRAAMNEIVPTRHARDSVFGIKDPLIRSKLPPSTDPRLGAT